MESDDTAMVQLLRSRGHRVTPQRLLVLSCVRDAAGHISAQDVERRARQVYSEIDVSTVYRTLISMAQHGVIVRFDRPGHEIEFEWLEAEHHHLICDRCDRVQTLDPGLLSSLGATLLQARGFEVDMRHLSLRGICEGCR